MDFLLLGSLFCLFGYPVVMFGYPVVMALLAFWLSRRAISSNSLTLRTYMKQGILTAVLPPTILVLSLTLLGLLDYKGFCFGWMNNGSKACGMGVCFQLQLFLGFMLSFVPSLLVGIGLTIICFLWHWARHPKPPVEVTPDSH